MKRLRPPDIRPLEIWDAKVAGRPLFEWQSSDEFPSALEVLVDQLRREHRFARVHLLGGGALAPGLAQRLSASVAADPVFSAARAGGALYGACADVGQTAIKVVAAGAAMLCARDHEQAPLHGARESTLAFLARSLAPLRSSRSYLLALPCALGDGPALSECTYAWQPGDLPGLLRAARLDPAGAWLVNDAELAALSWAHDPRAAPERTLVLTIGFGVGAALWR